MKELYGLAKRLVADEEELVMTHDTKSARTYSQLVAINERTNTVREIARFCLRVDGDRFKLLSWEALSPGIGAELSAAIDALVA